METTGRNTTHDDLAQPPRPGLPHLLLIWPCVLTLASDAGTGHDNVDEPTLVALAALTLLDEVRWGAVFVVVVEVGVRSVNEGAEVEEMRGGLGLFESVSHVILLLVLGLDPESEDLLLLVELPQVADGVAVGVEVGSKPLVFLLVGVIDEGVSMGGAAVEEFDEPGG